MARKPKKVAGKGTLFDVYEVADFGGYDPNSPIPPADFPEFDPATIDVDRCCPRCAYRWSSGGEGADPTADE